MNRSAYLGRDSVVYFKNHAGHHIIAPDPSHPCPPGYQRMVAETVPDVERLWKILSAQETERIARLNERDFHLRERKLIEMQRNMHEHLKQTRNAAEADFIRAGLRAIENKWNRLQKSSVYGVAFMESTEAPLPPAKVTS